MYLTSNTSITKYSRISKKYADNLKKLGIKTLRDLVYHFPFRYEDFSNLAKIDELEPEQFVTIKAKVQNINLRHSFRRRNFSIIEGVIADDTGALKVIWFNQPFILQGLRKGTIACFSGRRFRSISKYILI